MSVPPNYQPCEPVFVEALDTLPPSDKRASGPWSFDQQWIDQAREEHPDWVAIYVDDKGTTISGHIGMQAGHLIVAAPELLAIVRELCEYAGGMEYDTYRMFVNRAKEALDKAEGRTNV